MKNFIIQLNIMLLFFLGLSFAQNFRIPILVKDNCNNSINIWFGVDQSATSEYDPGIDTLAPPPPPGGFDARYIWLDENYFTDIRDNTLIEKQFKMYYQKYEVCSPITLYWDNNFLSPIGKFEMVDDLTGTLWGPLDMTSTNNLAITSELIFIQNSLRILATPFGQLDLSIENQQTIGTDFFFDLYLTSGGTNDIYLANAEFILSFDAINFNSPEIMKEGTSPGGYCTFVPSDISGNNIIETQETYFTNTSVTIQNTNELKISLIVPTPIDLTTLNTRIAKIDQSPNTHRLGRFKVSDINNPAGFMNLQWLTGLTQVYSFVSSVPFTSLPTIVNAIPPSNTALPVELFGFLAQVSGDKILLNWWTKTEISNFGFNVERSTCNNENNRNKWITIGFVNGYGNSNSPKSYSFLDKNPSGGSKFAYRLKQIDTDGTYKYSDEVEALLVITDYTLFQNYPNPFNSTTTVIWKSPEDGWQTLKVFDVLGNEVATLIDEYREAGKYEVEFNAAVLTSGVYFYQLQAGSFVETKKMILLR